jgi:hypothetical protein
MTKSNSNKIVELYPEMFTFSMRGYEHNIFEKGYNKALAYIHKHIKWTRSIDYIQQTNPYKAKSFELIPKIKTSWLNCPKTAMCVGFYLRVN